jgi:hypothetical protein
MQAAVDTCYQQEQRNAPDGSTLGAGNCEVYLGGQYKISSPIITRQFNNLIFGFGGLVAGSNWTAGPDDNFLVHNGGSWQRGHNFPELYLDGMHVAGGLRLNSTCAMTIGPGAITLPLTVYHTHSRPQPPPFTNSLTDGTIDSLFYSIR